ALDFYRRAFGFEKRFTMPGADGQTRHAEMSRGEVVIMFGPEGGCPARAPASSGVPAPIGLYLYCDDVDKLFATATAAGAKVVQAPQDMFWGDRMCSLSDPDGHSWSFATNVADCDPSKFPQ